MKRVLIFAAFWVSIFAAEKPGDFLRRPDEWFQSDDGKRAVANILSFQAEAGDWPKNTNTAEKKFAGDRKALKGTFDNGGTISELRFLAKAFRATKEAEYQKAFLKGLDHILDAQYANGGWPQTAPPGKGYDRHITFNDGTMVNLTQFARDVGSNRDFDFVDSARRERARNAFDRGVECILKCQIRVDGKRTVWCAQHDQATFEPRPARTYELPSFSGSESAGIVSLLMSLPNPKPEAVAAVDGAVAWFEKAKLIGIREVRVDDPKSPKGWDKRVVEDKDAPPLWARFYDLKTMKPMFVDRDGIPKEKLSEIGYERRNGYAWLGAWPARILVEYPQWKARHSH